MAKTKISHDKVRSANRSAQYLVRRNGVAFIIRKSFDNKQEA